MARGTPPNTLIVEGKDDQHAIIHLLKLHGIDIHALLGAGQFDVQTAKSTNLNESGVEALLKSIDVRVKARAQDRIGFVVDADQSIIDRWAAIRNRLDAVSVAVPNQPSANGFIGASSVFRTRVGVWLMPDNTTSGAIEQFLKRLIAEDDRLIGYAQTAAKTARRRGARFSDADFIKAQMHTWLAWQPRPGMPYGTAIAAHCFGHDKPLAKMFVAWFRRLFEL